MAVLRFDRGRSSSLVAHAKHELHPFFIFCKRITAMKLILGGLITLRCSPLCVYHHLSSLLPFFTGPSHTGA